MKCLNCGNKSTDILCKKCLDKTNINLMDWYKWVQSLSEEHKLIYYTKMKVLPKWDKDNGKM